MKPFSPTTLNEKGKWKVGDDLYIDERSQRMIDANIKELLQERELAQLALDATKAKGAAEFAKTSDEQA